MNKFTVVTTINKKTEAVSRMETLPGWHTIVIGDDGTPPIISTPKLTYLPLSDQNNLQLSLPLKLPLRHYARKNIGYLLAMYHDCESIYDTDDDTIPYSTWEAEPFSCDRIIASKNKFINSYQFFTHQLVWPRGYPLDEIQRPDTSYEIYQGSPCQVGIWQSLVNDDPDVDAIYRMVISTPVKFTNTRSFCLPIGSYCPVNSQNTFWRKECIPLTYLPSTVKFRYTDILRGFVAQRIMWENGFHLGLQPPVSYQIRNHHYLMDDFLDEMNCYIDIKRLVSVLDRMSLGKNLIDNLYICYERLAMEELVPSREIPVLEAWIHDFRKISGDCHGKNEILDDFRFI